MTHRTGFVLRVKPERVDEYVHAHRADFETDDLTRSSRHLASQEVSTRWQDAMAALLEERVPDAGPQPLEQVFRLD